MFRHREEASGSLRKGAIAQIINTKRYANLSTQNKLMIDQNELNQEWMTYYNSIVNAL
jgi:hypothetical protein